MGHIEFSPYRNADEARQTFAALPPGMKAAMRRKFTAERAVLFMQLFYSIYPPTSRNFAPTEIRYALTVSHLYTPNSTVIAMQNDWSASKCWQQVIFGLWQFTGIPVEQGAAMLEQFFHEILPTSDIVLAAQQLKLIESIVRQKEFSYDQSTT